MKKLIILSLSIFISVNSFSQIENISGKVIDSETKLPLHLANIFIKGTNVGTTSDEKGDFLISGRISNSDTLIISFLGYKNYLKRISDINLKNILIELNKLILPSQTILVEASVGEKGTTPITFEKIKRSEIEKDYHVQDVPDYLSQLPSTTFYSENGNGIGYNYLSIRGFDQRRISVSINGIPQNDPEDHNVYWLDSPDLLASTEMIQVQRGAGSGVIGYPAIGGSINIITSPFSDKPRIDLSSLYGSYNTRKYSISFSSGLINNKYSVYAKLSQILSSGYRNSSWTKFNSFHFSVVRYDDKLTTQLNLYGGPISDGLAYTGIAKFAIKDKDLRRANYSDWGASNENYSYAVIRRPEEIENFSQPHFELLNEYQFSPNIKFNSATFMVLGSGFFDYDGSWAIPDYGYNDYFRLKLNGYDSSYVPSNALIRAQVDNKQFGWIPRLSIDHKNGQLIIGGEFRVHRSDHWGSINFADNLPPDLTKGYRYYFYNGAKDIVNGFANEYYKYNEHLNILAELQIAYHKYRLYNEMYVSNDFHISNLFLNPRLGINYKINDNQNIFISFARVTHEPRLKNYYDAAESSAGEKPQFEVNPDGSYNFSDPLVKPETMNDMEIGTSLINNFVSCNLNLYNMIFDNEIISNGEVDRFGQPITGNVSRTIHTGIELTGNIKLSNNFHLLGNISYSKNKINSGKYFIDANNFIDISNNNIGGFPEMLSNLGLQYEDKDVFLKLNAKYVGKFYSDNFGNNLKNYLAKYPDFVSYNDNINDAYFVVDFYASCGFKLFNALDKSKIFFQVNNVFDNFYSAFAIGKEFFPAAERNFLAGLQLSL
jgi:iron complex outermembrane receptor protein